MMPQSPSLNADLEFLPWRLVYSTADSPAMWVTRIRSERLGSEVPVTIVERELFLNPGKTEEFVIAKLEDGMMALREHAVGAGALSREQFGSIGSWVERALSIQSFPFLVGLDSVGRER